MADRMGACRTEIVIQAATLKEGRQVIYPYSHRTPAGRIRPESIAATVVRAQMNPPVRTPQVVILGGPDGHGAGGNQGPDAGPMIGFGCYWTVSSQVLSSGKRWCKVTDGWAALCWTVILERDR